MTGTTNRKIIVVPCIVISWLYVSGSSSVLLATPSCRRMSSASVPPSMKNTKVRTRYMIPMRLWSVVVTHDVQPVRSRSTLCAATWGTATGAVISCVAMSVGSAARLQALLDALALAGGGLVGPPDRGALAVEPGFEVVGRHRGHFGDHVGVVAPAELGALTREGGAGELAGDLEPGVVRVARDGVEIAAELRDPPGVGDVLGVDVEGDGRVDRDDHLLVGERRAEVLAGLRIAVGLVGVAPDVLLAVDADVQRLAVGRQAAAGVGQLEARGRRVRRVADRVELDERDRGEDHEDHRGADRPADLQARVAPD